MAEIRRAKLSGLEFRYAEVPGSDPPILFLHGGSDSLDSYLSPMTMLSGTAHMFAIDFKGHGFSDHMPGKYRVCDHSKDVREFVESIVCQRPLIAGHSLGALVAAFIAGSAPGLLLGAFLEDPPIYTAQMPKIRGTPDYQIFRGLHEVLRDHKESGRSIEDLAALVGTWPIHPMLFGGRPLLEVAGKEAVRARAESLHRMDFAALEPILDGSQFDGFDPDVDLTRIQVPVHLLAGEVAFGGTIDQDDIERLNSLIPKFSHRTLPGVGHFIHQTAPADYVQELEAVWRRMA